MLTPLYADANLALLFLRIVLGMIFLKHGMPKLGGSMGSFMRLVGVLEVAGALLLITGLCTVVGSLLITVVMIGAIWKKVTEWHVPFSATDKLGWEVDLLIIAACTVLLCFGAGQYAVDATSFVW